MSTEKDMKYDKDKIRLDLVDPIFIENVGRVLTFGAKKYAAYSWRTVDDAPNRYYAAAMRHLLAYKRGEQFDEESGLSHLSHATTNLMFLDYFERRISLPNLRGRVENAAEAVRDALRNPPCFGSDPSPQTREGLGCTNCKLARECLTSDIDSRPGSIKYVKEPGTNMSITYPSCFGAYKNMADCKTCMFYVDCSHYTKIVEQPIQSICPFDMTPCDAPKEPPCTTCPRKR